MYIKTDKCCMCGESMELCDINGSDETFAEYCCRECGRTLCDCCWGEMPSMLYGDECDEDIDSICLYCADKLGVKHFAS